MSRPDDLMARDGENLAVRSFLMQYSCDRSVTVGWMRKHMEMCGWEKCWPEWADGENPDAHLTKGGAQDWLRYLFSLECRAPAQGAADQGGAPC